MQTLSLQIFVPKAASVKPGNGAVSHMLDADLNSLTMLFPGSFARAIGVFSTTYVNGTFSALAVCVITLMSKVPLGAPEFKSDVLQEK